MHNSSYNIRSEHFKCDLMLFLQDPAGLIDQRALYACCPHLGQSLDFNCLSVLLGYYLLCMLIVQRVYAGMLLVQVYFLARWYSHPNIILYLH
jgi:hypothetical protein